MSGGHGKFTAGAIAVLVLGIILMLWAKNEYVFFASYVVLQFVVLATAWNILGGYAGYVNFGTAAFFALGGYTAVFAIKSMGAPLLVQIALAAAVCGLLGLIIGLLSLRLRGIFFSIATVAMTIIIETCITNSEYLGGAKGIQLTRPPPTAPFTSYIEFLFFVMLCMAVIAVAIARYVENSWIGRGLRAIRDNEEAAESVGVPTLKLKLIATVISGALMGAAGAPMPMYLNFIEPVSAFSLNYSVSALAMPIIGGTSSWIGPVIGALLLASVQQAVTVTISSELNVLIIGVLLVFFVVAAPDGILGLVRKFRAGRGGDATQGKPAP
ncbi:MAG: branched-chain amino acid ABC transporter permease [Burkholderiales bacterium]|nr:branched-chain amino acid ABC transporter permease [Burkholderiales bacterium]